MRASLPIAFLALAAAAPASAQRGEDPIVAARQTAISEAALERRARFVDARGNERFGVRCATPEISELERRLDDAYVQARLEEVPSVKLNSEIVVPVFFHVLRKNNGAFDVTDEQIADQIDVLNDAFEGHGFRFEHAGTRRYSKNRYAKRCLSRKVEFQFKSRHAVDPATTLNVYTCLPGQDVLGYATFPSQGPEDDPLHGIVVRYSTLPGGDSVPYDEGDTVVHEAGHYLGLYHTFQLGCVRPGDRVGDTAREGTPTHGCPVAKDTCPQNPGLDPVENFMDYTDDACMLRFTPGQRNRMRKQVAVHKPSLGG